MVKQKSNHIQQDNNSLIENKTIDKANTKVNARKKVGCSDDLTARTKAHMVHSYAEVVSVFNPVKSSNQSQLAPSARKSSSERMSIYPQGEKRRTVLYSAKASAKAERVKHGPLSGKEGITPPVETNTLSIQQEMEKDTEDLFKKMDKLFEEYFGKMCPDFNPNCIQCKVNLAYNNFKKQIWEEFIKK